MSNDTIANAKVGVFVEKEHAEAIKSAAEYFLSANPVSASFVSCEIELAHYNYMVDVTIKFFDRGCGDGMYFLGVLHGAKWAVMYQEEQGNG